MALRDVFKIHSGTFKVLGVVILITAGIASYAYVKHQNFDRASDPRVVKARKAYGRYGKLMRENRYDEALKMLDKIEEIYHAVPGYVTSYESGVFFVDRGSVYLIRVEEDHLKEEKTIPEKSLELYLEFAKKHTQAGIDLYKKWLDTTGQLNDNEIRKYVDLYFKKNDPAFRGYNFDKIFSRRCDEIRNARIEVPRRLSVAYTNMGVILRYKHKNEDSKSFYEEALKLWPENHVAEDNLRVLHGQKVEKRSIIKQMFPKERIEKARENMKK